MYVASYTFTGDPTDLANRYSALMADFPPDDVILQLSLIGEKGLTIIDGCPDRATFESFSRAPEFAAALQRHGLPTPTIAPIGELHNLVVGKDVTP